MAKNKSTAMMPTPEKVMKTENGTQYFVCGNSRIKISEHFAMDGKTIGDLIVDVVRHTVEKASSA